MSRAGIETKWGRKMTRAYAVARGSRVDGRTGAT